MSRYAHLQGMSAQDAFAAIKRQHEARDACPGHSFTRVDNGEAFPRYRCDHCRWEPSAVEKDAYLRGLEHGKRFGVDCNCNPLANTGGGHSRTCPEYQPEWETTA